jgi:hypothetical protein
VFDVFPRHYEQSLAIWEKPWVKLQHREKMALKADAYSEAYANIDEKMMVEGCWVEDNSPCGFYSHMNYAYPRTIWQSTVRDGASDRYGPLRFDSTNILMIESPESFTYSFYEMNFGRNLVKGLSYDNANSGFIKTGFGEKNPADVILPFSILDFTVEENEKHEISSENIFFYIKGSNFLKTEYDVYKWIEGGSSYSKDSNCRSSDGVHCKECFGDSQLSGGKCVEETGYAMCLERDPNEKDKCILCEPMQRLDLTTNKCRTGLAATDRCSLSGCKYCSWDDTKSDEKCLICAKGFWNVGNTCSNSGSFDNLIPFCENHHV